MPDIFSCQTFLSENCKRHKVENETLASGARQLVVQLALETILSSDLYSCSLTPTTNMGASLLGAEMTTFFAPP